MNYLYARHEQEMITDAYRIYITDSFYLQGQGKAFNERWCDLVNPKIEDDKTAEEIAMEVMANAGLKFGGE